MRNIGKMLKEKREKLNLSYEDVSEKTKLTVVNIKALEEGDFHFLEDDITYVKFYLKAYCKVLGIDFNQIKDEFEASYLEYTQSIKLDSENNRRNIEESINEKKNVSNNKKEIKKVKEKKVRSKRKIDFSMISLLVIALIVAGVVVASGVKLVRDKVSHSDSSEPKVSEQAPKPEKSANKKVDDTKKKEKKVEESNNNIKVSKLDDFNFDVTGVKLNKKYNIKITFSADCWLNANINGVMVSELPEKVYKKGETVVVSRVSTANDILRINAGNGKAIEISVDGKKVDRTDATKQPTASQFQLNIKGE